MDWHNWVVIVGAFVFFLFLLWRFRPGVGVKDVRRLAKSTLDARARARAATTPRERAQALCDAGDSFASQRGGGLAAFGHYLRAMRLDPTWTEPLLKSRAVLWSKHPLILERVLWRRLSLLDWEGDTRQTVQTAASLLAELYKHQIRNRTRARAMSKLAASLSPASASSQSP